MVDGAVRSGSIPLASRVHVGQSHPGFCGRAILLAVTTKRPRHPFLFATLLTLLAGFLDAAAYAELNHLFVSFMSGNTTHLGIVIASGSLPDCMVAAMVIIAFIVGSATGTLISGDGEGKRLLAVMGTETGLFAVAFTLALLGQAQPALMLMAFTMGVQNVLHQSIDGTDMGKGFVTGTLFRLGQSLAHIFSDVTVRQRACLYLTSWSVFIGGAVAGTLILSSFGLAISIACGGGLLIAMMAALIAGWL